MGYIDIKTKTEVFDLNNPDVKEEIDDFISECENKRYSLHDMREFKSSINNLCIISYQEPIY